MSVRVAMRELLTILLKAGAFFCLFGFLRGLALGFVRRGKGAEDRILVVCLDNLGDVVLASGSLAGYARAFPEKEIAFLCDAGSEAVGSMLFTETITIDRRRFRRSLAYSVRVLAALKRQGFGTVIHHSTVQLSTVEYWGLLRHLGGMLVGYAGEEILAHPPKTAFWERFALHVLHPYCLKRHARVVASVDRGNRTTCPITNVLAHYAAFFEGATGTPIDPAPSLPHATPEAAYAVIGLGAAVGYRRWPVERFAEIARYLERAGLHIVLVGSRVERELGEAFLRLMPDAENTIGTTSLDEVVRKIAGARIIVSNETSFAHLAVALKTPSVCVLGGGHLGRCSLYGYPDITKWVYDANASCRCDNWACGRNAGAAPSPCIESISVEKVREAAEAVLAMPRMTTMPFSLFL